MKSERVIKKRRKSIKDGSTRIDVSEADIPSREEIEKVERYFGRTGVTPKMGF